MEFLSFNVWSAFALVWALALVIFCWKRILSPNKLLCLLLLNVLIALYLAVGMLEAGGFEMLAVLVVVIIWSYAGGWFRLRKLLKENSGTFLPNRLWARGSASFFYGVFRVNGISLPAYTIGGVYSFRLGQKYRCSKACLRNGRIYVHQVMKKTGETSN